MISFSKKSSLNMPTCTHYFPFIPSQPTSHMKYFMSEEGLEEESNAGDEETVEADKMEQGDA